MARERSKRDGETKERQRHQETERDRGARERRREQRGKRDPVKETLKERKRKRHRERDRYKETGETELQRELEMRIGTDRERGDVGDRKMAVTLRSLLSPL